MLLLGQVWDNPRPDVKIASISYTPDKNDTAVLLSAGVIGIISAISLISNRFLKNTDSL